MATRVTDGVNDGCRPRFARLAASPLRRACIALTKSEEKERLLAVYIGPNVSRVFGVNSPPSCLLL